MPKEGIEDGSAVVFREGIDDGFAFVPIDGVGVVGKELGSKLGSMDGFEHFPNLIDSIFEEYPFSLLLVKSEDGKEISCPSMVMYFICSISAMKKDENY